ncbi:MAG TPA: SDR family NAD(P)-dependent oxidoreductase [Acidimicrobiales bacterium]|nr:SDR family NAD(P)-dependent oxidoreductase [Acidimicrobiales bacterium]
MTELRGSTALVTGATGGLGRAIARALKDEGCSLVVTGRQAGPLDQVAAEVGGRAVVADLSRREDLSRLLDQAGPLDIAVMNAALPASGELQDWEQEEIDRVLEVNLANPIAMTRALLPAFLARGSGHFVYISSLSGKVASRGAPLYSGTKYGLRGFAHGLRCDLNGTGVGCSVINPGFVRDAGMFADSGTKLPPGVGTVSPQQVAGAVVRAIRSNRADVDVAPLGLRLGATFGSLLPGISSVVQARFGAGISNQMVEGQRHKRA